MFHVNTLNCFGYLIFFWQYSWASKCIKQTQVFFTFYPVPGVQIVWSEEYVERKGKILQAPLSNLPLFSPPICVLVFSCFLTAQS